MCMWIRFAANERTCVHVRARFGRKTSLTSVHDEQACVHVRMRACAYADARVCVFVWKMQRCAHCHTSAFIETYARARAYVCTCMHCFPEANRKIHQNV